MDLFTNTAGTPQDGSVTTGAWTIGQDPWAADRLESIERVLRRIERRLEAIASRLPKDSRSYEERGMKKTQGELLEHLNATLSAVSGGDDGDDVWRQEGAQRLLRLIADLAPKGLFPPHWLQDEILSTYHLIAEPPAAERMIGAAIGEAISEGDPLPDLMRAAGDLFPKYREIFEIAELKYAMSRRRPSES